MSHTSSPSPGSPAPYVIDNGTPSPALSGASVKPKPKPVNVFTNDGSFLQRFQRSKKGDEERRKQEETMNRKMSFENRFKNRGKRPRPDADDNSSSTTPMETTPPVSSTAGDKNVIYANNPAKKAKLETRANRLKA